MFSGAGGYSSPQSFVSGLVPAVFLAAGLLALGALAALAIPALRRTPIGSLQAGASPA